MTTRAGFATIVRQNQQIDRLRAALKAMLPEFKGHRQTMFECVTNKHGQYDDDGARDLIASLDDIIANAEQALRQ